METEVETDRNGDSTPSSAAPWLAAAVVGHTTPKAVWHRVGILGRGVTHLAQRVTGANLDNSVRYAPSRPASARLRKLDSSSSSSPSPAHGRGKRSLFVLT